MAQDTKRVVSYETNGATCVDCIDYAAKGKCGTEDILKATQIVDDTPLCDGCYGCRLETEWIEAHPQDAKRQNAADMAEFWDGRF